MALAGVFIALFIAARWQKTGVLTAAEYLTRRLDYHYQKYFTPVLFDLTLSRAAEMGMGVGLPALLLFISEIILWKRNNPSPGFKEIFNQENDGAKILETKQSTANQSGIRKLGLGVAAVGLLMFTLGFYVSEDGFYLIIASLPVLVTAFFMWHKSKSNP